MGRRKQDHPSKRVKRDYDSTECDNTVVEQQQRGDNIAMSCVIEHKQHRDAAEAADTRRGDAVMREYHCHWQGCKFSCMAETCVCPDAGREDERDDDSRDGQQQDIKRRGCQQLHEHICTRLPKELAVHVLTHCDSSQMACMWRGCKAKGEQHRTRQRLQRHVSEHTGYRQLICYIRNCHSSFDTAAMLEQHMQAHFTAPTPGQRHGGRQQERDGASSKASEKTTLNWSRLSMPLSAQTIDRMQQILARIDAASEDDSLIVPGRCIATATDANGAMRSLIEWDFNDMFPSSWIDGSFELGQKTAQRVSLKSMPFRNVVRFVDQRYASPAGIRFAQHTQPR